jgi:hypothetical protein
MASTSLANGLVGLGRGRGQVPHWLTVVARLGFAAKGFVYTIIAILAAVAAAGSGAPEGSRGAISALKGQPFGYVLLLLIALGIASYAFWRLAAAIVNPEGKSALRRAGYLVTVVVYAGLTVEAVRLALGGRGSGGGEDAPTHWTARLMAQPFGAWLVGAVAIGIAAYGAYQIYKAWKADVGDELRLNALGREPRRAVMVIARAGLAARGIVFLVIGGFLASAAMHADPSEARGMAGSLEAIQQQPYGPYLLAAVAVGLLAYGLYQFVRARYQRIGAPR